jgi:hypothetical protein
MEDQQHQVSPSLSSGFLSTIGDNSSPPPPSVAGIVSTCRHQSSRAQSRHQNQPIKSGSTLKMAWRRCCASSCGGEGAETQASLGDAQRCAHWSAIVVVGGLAQRLWAGEVLMTRPGRSEHTSGGGGGTARVPHRPSWGLRRKKWGFLRATAGASAQWGDGNAVHGPTPAGGGCRAPSLRCPFPCSDLCFQGLLLKSRCGCRGIQQRREQRSSHLPCRAQRPVHRAP